VPRNQEEHSENSVRENYDEHRILNVEPTSPEFLAATFHELSTKSSCNAAMQQFQQAQPSWQPSQRFYPQSQAIQSIQQPQPIREILPQPPDSSSRPEPSSRPQNSKALPSFGAIMPITRGSAMEFETKKQRNNYFRSVNTIINDGPAARPEWAKVPITFTEEDFKLKSANHNDAMVIEVNIAG
jgi:hypothetical protein